MKHSAMATDGLIQSLAPMFPLSHAVAGHGEFWQLFQAGSCTPRSLPEEAASCLSSHGAWLEPAPSCLPGQTTLSGWSQLTAELPV